MCEYCEGMFCVSSKTPVIEGSWIHDHNDMLRYVPISFCPFCGRDLRKDVKRPVRKSISFINDTYKHEHIFRWLAPYCTGTNNNKELMRNGVLDIISELDINDKESFTKFILDQEIYAAVSDQHEITGFVALEAGRKTTIEDCPKVDYLYAIAVKKKYRGHFIATSLLNEFTYRCQAVNPAVAVIWNEDPAMNKLLKNIKADDTALPRQNIPEILRYKDFRTVSWTCGDILEYDRTYPASY